MKDSIGYDEYLRVSKLMGQFVLTKDGGEGILVGCNVPTTNLQVDYSSATWLVWFGYICPPFGVYEMTYLSHEIFPHTGSSK